MLGNSQYRLVMRRGPQADRAFPILKDVVTIGRDASNDIVIADPEVSRQHSRLSRQANGGLVIEDLGSTNGTYVNGTRLAGPQLLNNGDSIGLGETITLMLQISSGEGGETVVGMSGVRPATPAGGIAAPTRTAPPPPPPSGVYMPGPATPPPVYAQPQAQPQVPVQAPPKSNTTRNLLLGCGCLFMACVLCAAGFWAFDALNLYSVLCPVVSFFCTA